MPYASGPGWKATELRYVGADGSTPLAMTLILPDDIAAFEAGPTPAKLDSIIAKLDRSGRGSRKLTTRRGTGDMACPTYAYRCTCSCPGSGSTLGPGSSPSSRRWA